MTLELSKIRRSLVRFGWATASGTLKDVDLALLRERSSARPRQLTPVDILRPHSQEDAPRRSLSAMVGLGAQPLHTDGAHLRRPPDVIVLASALPSTTPTVVFRPDWATVPSGAHDGIFTVRGNGVSFLAPAWDYHRLRYDPGCMAPSDHLAREAQEYFASARSGAHVHEWDTPNQLLFIDNKRVLHARNEVTDPETRVIERMALKMQEVS